MAPTTTIQLYYFGASKRGFEQYPSPTIDLFKRHDRRTSNENWRFIASRQGEVCYYEYVVQGVRTALEGGRAGGRFGLAIAVRGYYFADPLKALDILKDIVKLLLKQGQIIKELTGEEIAMVPDSLSYKAAYLDDFAKGMADYILSKHQEDLWLLTNTIPSITVPTLAEITSIEAAKRPTSKPLQDRWNRKGAIGLTSYKVPPAPMYTKEQVKQIVKERLEQERSKIRAEEQARARESVKIEQSLPPETDAPPALFLRRNASILLLILLFSGGWCVYKLFEEQPVLTKDSPVFESSRTENKIVPIPNIPAQQVAIPNSINNLCPDFKDKFITTHSYKEGKIRLYLHSKAFLTKYQGIAITNYRALEDLIWKSMEGCIQDKYGSREKMIQQIQAMNPTGFKSLEAFIKDQLDTAQTKVLLIQSNDNFIFAMQGHANLKTGKILKNPKGGGELLLYKEP